MDEKLAKYVFREPGIPYTLLTFNQPRREPERHGTLSVWINRRCTMSLASCRTPRARANIPCQKRAHVLLRFRECCVQRLRVG